MKRKRTATRKINLTKRSIESLRPKPGQRVTIYDSQVRGLGIVCQPSGAKAYFWFRKIGGIAKWRTVGSTDDLSVEQARNFAQEWNSRLATWKASDYQGPAPLEERRDGLTISELLHDYCSKHLAANAKNAERAIQYAKWQADTYFPQWKARKLHSIRREDVRELHRHLGEEHGETTGNRVAQLIRTLYNFAKREGLWAGTENPASSITMFRESSRTRFLRPEELARLFAALNSRATPRDLRDFCLMALFTGARKSNVMSMRWDQVVIDSDSPTWTIPDVNSKSGVGYTIPLVDEACEVIKKRRAIASDSPWIFPSVTSASGHLEDVKRNWQALLDRAEITDLRVHDLRRSLGSWQAGLGASLLVIGKSLGHSSIEATSVYSRLSLDPVRESVAAAVTAMQIAAKKNPAAPKPMKRKLKQLKA
jgi:integrase